MKLDAIGNQRGEVMTGVMVAIMVVVMLFGGMHAMHGGYRHGDGHDTAAHKHDHQKEDMNCMQGHNEESHSVHSEETGTQR